MTALWLINDIEDQPYDVCASNWGNLAYFGRTIRSSLKIASTFFNAYLKGHNKPVTILEIVQFGSGSLRHVNDDILSCRRW